MLLDYLQMLPSNFPSLPGTRHKEHMISNSLIQMVSECKNLPSFIADFFYYCCSLWRKNGHLVGLVPIWPFKSLREKLSSGHETLFLWWCWTFWTRYILHSVQTAGTLSFAYLFQLLHSNNNSIFWSGSCRNSFFFPLDYFSKSLADSSYNVSQRPVCLLKLSWTGYWREMNDKTNIFHLQNNSGCVIYLSSKRFFSLFTM